jgi:hypothetical protein
VAYEASSASSALASFR